MVERRVLRQVHYSPIEEQNDRRTAELGSKVQELQFITVELRDEIKRQNEDLKRSQGSMDSIRSLLGQTRQRVTLLTASGSWRIYKYLFLFSLLVFLGIYYLIHV